MSNSKQSNFFIMAEDWPAISDFFKRNDIMFIKMPVEKNADNLFSDNISTKNENESFQVYLCKKEHKDKVILRQEKDGYDILRSYTIEFSRGGVLAPIQQDLSRFVGIPVQTKKQPHPACAEQGCFL